MHASPGDELNKMAWDHGSGERVMPCQWLHPEWRLRGMAIPQKAQNRGLEKPYGTPAGMAFPLLAHDHGLEGLVPYRAGGRILCSSPRGMHMPQRARDHGGGGGNVVPCRCLHLL